jgi:hypothetical protein
MSGSVFLGCILFQMHVILEKLHANQANPLHMESNWMLSYVKSDIFIYPALF